MTFDDIHYLVDLPKDMKDTGAKAEEPGAGTSRLQLELLQGINGAFVPQVLTCLMGVSGAGKTTLMDVLAGRKTSGKITGDIRINGHPKQQATFARVSGYVEQSDVHSPQTTVREALLFSASLRIGPSVPADRINAFVEEMLDLVELHSLQDALVGSPGVSGLSVEQRKRLTIAVELVANPSIVFMDEPTSGLDARAAAIVMRTVRNIANTGRTIVCTIHQPSIDIFESFDELLLLKRGGQTIYAGPLGKDSVDLVRYFEEVPGIDPISITLNPATWMLEVTTPGNEKRLGVDFAEIYSNSSMFRRRQQLIAEAMKADADVPPLHFDSPYACGAMRQYLVMLQKFNSTYWRTPSYNATRFTFTLAIAIVFGTTFWKLGNKTESEQDLTNTLGALYTSTVFLGVMNSIFVQPVVFDERSVSYRERAAGMYSVQPWYLAMASVEAMYLCVQAILYTCTVYFMAGFAREAGDPCGWQSTALFV
ncbi:transcription factor, variant 2 [Trebouxia sp. C0009 RCD-2024]